jgi:hypothetical protein
MLMIILCMIIMYLWPGMTLWLPNYLYGAVEVEARSVPNHIALVPARNNPR